MAPKIKLTFFDTPTRGEMPRLTLVLGKIPFEDERVSFDDWPTVKATMPLGSLPFSEIDGSLVVQSMALTRYFGTISGLYPSDPWKQLMVDQVVETVMDMQSSLLSLAFIGKSAEEVKAMREKKIAVDGPRYWGGCEKILERISDGPFVLGKEVSIADVVITVIYLLVRSEYLDYIPYNALDKYPKMYNVFKSVMEIPHVRAWYKEHPFKNYDR